LLNASESGRPLELWTTKWPDGDLPLICLKTRVGLHPGFSFLKKEERFQPFLDVIFFYRKMAMSS